MKTVTTRDVIRGVIVGALLTILVPQIGALLLQWALAWS